MLKTLHMTEQFITKVVSGSTQYLSDVLLLLFELAVVVVHLLIKPLAPINKVARVDSDLLKALSDHAGYNRLEVDICHQGHIIPVTPGNTWHYGSGKLLCCTQHCANSTYVLFVTGMLTTCTCRAVLVVMTLPL